VWGLIGFGDQLKLDFSSKRHDCQTPGGVAVHEVPGITSQILTSI
jgi:hypothetical protein